MNQNWRRIATTLGFVSCLAMIAPACVVRARGAARVKPVYVVDEAPPRPKYRRVKPRPGHVWVRGRYEYRGGRWVWKAGHWKRARTGYRWEAGKWVRRGNRWHWTEGHWVRAKVRVGHSHRAEPRRVKPAPVKTAPTPPRRSGPKVRDHRRGKPAGTPAAYPTTPPPAPRAAPKKTRAGFVWIPGHYEWRAGDWKWVNGHWERARVGFRWKAGKWTKRGNRYVWVKGQWVKGAKVRDHRRKGRKHR